MNHRKDTSVKIIRSTVGAAALAVLLALSGCGSDSGSDTPNDSDPSASARPGRFDQARLEEIQKCLKAAGLEDAFPTDRPSGMPSDGPSGPPSDFDPDNPPEGMPSGGPSGRPGGGFGALQDPAVQEALEACGIDMPSPGQGSS